MCAAHMQCQHAGLLHGDYLGSLLLRHGSRDGAIAKAMLPQFAFQPLDGSHKLAEHQRLSCWVILPHQMQLHKHRSCAWCCLA